MKRSVNIPAGVWPVMLTPFRYDKSIDWYGMDALIDWYLASRCQGLFSVCGSGEMFELSNQERLSIATYVRKRVNGFIPTIASGTFEISVTRQSEFVKKMEDTGVDAVICLANHLATREQNDPIWEDNLRKLLDLTPDIPFGMYECPLPYHRLVPLSSISLLAGSKRFFWLKETSEDISLLKQKIASARGSDLKIFNAYTATILESLQAGAHGYSGIATNFYPALFVWLKNNFEKDPDTAKELQAFFVKAQKVVDHKYLSSAKQFLILCGLPITPETRISRSVFINQEMQALKNIRDEANQWHKILELPPIC